MINMEKSENNETVSKEHLNVHMGDKFLHPGIFNDLGNKTAFDNSLFCCLWF